MFSRRAAETLLGTEVASSRPPACRLPSDRPSRPSTSGSPAGAVPIADADDACVVHHLDQDHHVARRLHDLVVAVVHHRQHRRAGRRAERQQAAFAERASFRTIVGVAPHARRCVRCRLQRERRNAPVRRLDDHRGPILAVDDRDASCRDRSRTGCSCRPAATTRSLRSSCPDRWARHRLPRRAIAASLIASASCSRERAPLAELRRTLDRRRSRVRPDALQVGRAVGQSRQLVLARRCARRRQKPNERHRPDLHAPPLNNVVRSPFSVVRTSQRMRVRLGFSTHKRKTDNAQRGAGRRYFPSTLNASSKRPGFPQRP